MKILLIHNYFLAEDAVEQKVMRPYPPLGILYISAYLESKGVEHEVFDGTFSTREKLNELLLKERPHYIGFYVNFLLRKNVLKSIETIKNQLPDSKIILGGSDGRYHAENYLKNGADYIVLGEGEVSFFELITHLTKGVDISEINGIAFKSNDKITENPARDFIRNMDNIPFPNRKKIQFKNYLETWKKNHGYSSITINTQRGCPYTCKWCSHAVYGDTYRRRSPKNIIQELKEITEKYSPDRFWFVDDVFTMSKNWLRDFNQELKNENLVISYECISRADKLDEESIKLLKESGCSLVWIGAESGSQKVLDMMDRRVEVNQVREMMKLAKSSDIQTGTFIMLGYPGETEEDINESIKHLIASDPDFFTINKAYPIKGTKLYESVEDLIVGDVDWKATPDSKIDFKRTYKNRYYDFAIRKVYNSVWQHKYRRQGDWLKFSKCRVKSMVASIGMKLNK